MSLPRPWREILPQLLTPDIIVETLRRIRKYYQDGIINANGLNADSATIQAQFQAGKYHRS